MAQPNPRGIQIGAPGPNIPKVRYETTAGPVAAALAVYEATHQWIIPDSTTFIDELMNAGVMYEFDTLDDVFLWARIRLVTTELMRVVTTGANSQWRMRYRLLEAQRAEFQRVGELDPAAGAQVFTCLGINYTLVKSDTNHYYADRDGRTINYHGALTDTKLRSILGLLHGNRTADGADTAHIDEFVCACLAEPTRWPEEQAFTLLAAAAQPGDRALTGNVGAILLPMASGSTYEPATRRPGAQVPRRIISFARQLGLVDVIDQEINAAANQSLALFLAAMRGQYIS